MKKIQAFTFSLLLLGGCILVIVLMSSRPTARVTADSIFTPHPLTNASQRDVEQAALAYTRIQFPVRSGAPQILLIRAVRLQDLPALGLPTINLASIELPPLTLVIIKGDFNQGNQPGLTTIGTSQTIRYIGYIFDLWAGVPALTIASPTGGEFRTALNDATLPVVPTLPNGPISTAPKSLHYGEMAPTVAPHAP